MSNAPGDQKDHPAVVIRPPLIQRVFVLVFFLVWCGAVATGFVVAVAHGSPAAIFLAIMLAFGATLGYRMLRMCVEVHGNELLVRNFSRTKRVSRADIEGFRVGPLTGQPFGKAIQVLIRGDELVPLDVTVGTYFFGRGNELLERRMDELRRWLASS